MLPLTFVNPEDYDKIQPSDKVSLLDLKSLAPGKVSVTVSRTSKAFLVIYVGHLSSKSNYSC